MPRLGSAEIPGDLRLRLENARLDLLALFRTLDRLYLTPDNKLIHQLFELDADFAEALWGLDQPAGKLNISAMLRDTKTPSRQLPPAVTRLRNSLPSQVHFPVTQVEAAIRAKLDPAEAYNMVPGRNPEIR